jgi:predicted RNase H-like nuclease (RuvC/YqgF family)
MNELLIARIEAKITQLGEAKRNLEQQTTRLREENASMHLINKELQRQVDELNMKLSEQLHTGSKTVERDEQLRGTTRHRINELVKEIDECITLLNKYARTHERNFDQSEHCRPHLPTDSGQRGGSQYPSSGNGH